MPVLDERGGRRSSQAHPVQSLPSLELYNHPQHGLTCHNSSIATTGMPQVSLWTDLCCEKIASAPPCSASGPSGIVGASSVLPIASPQPLQPRRDCWRFKEAVSQPLLELAVQKSVSSLGRLLKSCSSWRMKSHLLIVLL